MVTDRVKDPMRWRRLMQGVHKARAEGASITAQVAGRPVGIIQGIAGSFNPFAIRPSYIPLERLSPKERIERMRDPVLRAQLLSEVPSERQLARLSQARQNMVGRWDNMFVMSGATPDYEPSPEKSIAAIAAKCNASPQEVAYDAIEAHLAGIGRSPTAFCACELRPPAQFTDGDFVAFNRRYVERLAAWGIFRGEVNPVARSSVCPEIDPPTTLSFYAFSYTVPSANSAARSFVAAGSGEAREGGASYEERIIRRGDQSPGAMREKAYFVLGALEQRMAALGFGWADVTATQVYTIFDIHPLLANEFVRRGAIPGGLTWHFARPPVQGLDFEVDMRGVAHELVI